MTFDLAMPELAETGCTQDYWLRLFIKSTTNNPVCNSILNLFMRLVDVASANYREARELLLCFASSTQFERGAVFRAVSCLETCIEALARASKCYRTIRGNREFPDEIRNLLGDKPTFAYGLTAKRIRDVRDATQHAYDLIISGRAKEGDFHTLRPTGETIVDPLTEQSISRIDRVDVFDLSLSFADLHCALEDLCKRAARLSAYEPKWTAKE